MLVLFLFNVILFHVLLTVQNNVENDVEELTDNLFENLRADPNLLGDLELSESSKAFIDRQVENYMNLVLKSHESEYSRFKRSLSENETTTDEYFVDIKPYNTIPTTSPKDIVLFQQNNDWYAACLEDDYEENVSNVLRIKKFQDNAFKQIGENEVLNGVRVAAFPFNTSTFIIVAENATARQDFEEQTSIFKLYQNEKLEVVQKINTSYSSDVQIWEVEDGLYMAVAQFMKEGRNGATLEVDMPIYKWYGGHFDIIQRVETTGALKITPFSMGGTYFLAVANSMTDGGDDKVYSEILQYDVETEEYKSFQRIITYRCTDIKHFKIDLNIEEEHFLVVANSYQRGGYRNENTTRSIVYKLVDNYFLPFQSIKSEGIVEWEPVTVEDGDVLLLASSSDGLKCFQYDGWQFIESQIQFGNDVTSQGIKAMHFYKFQDKTTVVIANENAKGNSTNMFEIRFSPENSLKRAYNEMLKWCLDNEEIIEENSDVDILGISSRGDVEVDSSSLQMDETDVILNTIRGFQSILDEVENQLQNSLQSPTKHVITSDLKAKHIILNDDGNLNSPDIETINSINMEDILENLFDVNDGFDVDSMEFDFLRTEEPISPTEINNLTTNSILLKNDNLEIDKLVVKGNVQLGEENKVGNVNNFTIDKNFVLLTKGDQNLDYLDAESVVIHNLETPTLNEFKTKLTENSVDQSDKIKKVKELKAKEVIVGGFINGVDMPTLDKYVLRISGDQKISSNYFFDSIEANNLDTDTLSGKNVLNDFVPITGGRFIINKDVNFAQDLSVNNLTALNYLDSIPVKGNRLDVLQRDSAEEQYVEGIKSFENLELLNPIKLQGKIRSKDLDTMSPVVTIDSNLDVNGDIRITGDVIVEEIIKSNDIVAGDFDSLRNVRQRALELTDPEVPIPLVFSSDVTVGEVFAERINNVDPASWTVSGAKQTQVVRGRKRFGDGLRIAGDARVLKINGIDVNALARDVLRQDGDQVISGTHHVWMVTADRRIKSNNITFGAHPWKNVITINRDQTINGTTTFKNNLASNATTVKNLTTGGLVNDVNISKIASDAVPAGTKFKIFGHKTFRNITIGNLRVKNSDIGDQMVSLEKNDLTIKKDVFFPNDYVEIKNIRFSGKCNGLRKDNFKVIVKDDNGTHSVEGDQEFDKVVVYGNVYIASDSISNVSFSNFVNNTVKTDEPFSFQSATFNGVVVEDGIELGGHVEGLDLDNVFENNKTQTQTIPDVKVFYGHVRVEGKVHFDRILNGFNVSDICRLSSSTSANKNLVIKGNAQFVKGPHVLEFNGYNVNNLQKTIWFTDEPTVVNGNIEFEGDVRFNNNITVMGLVNDVNLRVLSTNYLSKTKNQSVSAHMTFLDEVLFMEDISTPEIKLGGAVNEIDLKTFIKTVLLQEPQVFENAVYFENVTVKRVEGVYSVNNLNFDSDIMRYDKPNKVTGFKVFKDLQINHLFNERNITIQDVDILPWLNNSVLRGRSSKISGTKYFGNVTMEKGISVMGLLNGRKFSEKTVMLKNLSQDITGRKAFVRDGSEAIKFKALKVKGLVNNADIVERVHNQVIKTGDNVFKSEMHFHNNITAKNLVINKLCHGVNVTELLKNVSTLGALNDFEKSYRSLLQMSNEVENSLQGQAYFLHYFKPVTYIPNAHKIFGKSSDGEKSQIMAFNFENGSNILSFFEWNETQNLFMDTTEFSVNLGSSPSYINKVNLGQKDYIFIENEVDPIDHEGHTHSGRLIHFKSDSTHFDHRHLYTRGTIFVTSFELATEQHCLLFIYYDYEIVIVCDDFHGGFDLLQSIKTEMSFMASVININGNSYLTTMNKDEEEPRITIWKLNNESSSFEIYQTIYEEEPMSLTTISYNCGHYLAVAYGHLQRTMHLGRVSIRRFDEYTQEFIPWQNINLKTPTHAEFAILPSEELVLYILSENPTEPFNVYVYEGISGFSKKIVGSAIPQIFNMNQFSINNKHFVVAEHYDEINVIQAVFKGEKLS